MMASLSHLPSASQTSAGQDAAYSHGLTSLTSPKMPTASRGSNPLSAKVATVLSASYADADFRDALSLLDTRSVQNNAERRRQLRLDLQREVIGSNSDVIDEFGRVADQLRRIGHTLDKLNASHSEMKNQVAAASGTTSSLLGDAATLMHRRRQVETKQRLLKIFQSQFVLSNDEVSSLTMLSEPVDDDFFLALHKAKRINRNCEVLLGFENQTLGLDVMEQTSKTVNLAFQKLVKWIQREFKVLNLENPQIGSAIRRALRALAERPNLFQNCMDFFAGAREHVLSDAFFSALTGSSSSGDHTVKPIELAAHDPLRYVGDMLAWIHSAAVGEREALEVLFVSDGGELVKDIRAGRENEVWRLVADDGDEPAEFDATKALNDLVDRDVSGIARILRQRVEQVIQASEEAILAYKLANLLDFYAATFSKLLSEPSVLVDALKKLEAESMRQFRVLMRDHLAALQGSFQQATSDLEPPDFLHDALAQLVIIMETYDTSLAAPGSRESAFQPVLAEALDPFMEGCENMAGSIDVPNNSIFLANCLMAAKAVLAPFDFTTGHVGDLQARIDKLSHALIEYQYDFIRHGSGLDDMFNALGPLTTQKDHVEGARKLDALQPEVLMQASQRLDDFLPSALMDAMENIKQLQDSKLAWEITEEAAGNFCGDFEHVEDILVLADEQAELEDEGQGLDGSEPEPAQSLRALFPRTTGEIRVLLS